MWPIVFLYINLSYGMEMEECDHPTRWVYDAMGAWNAEKNAPTTYGRTGKGIGIAIIEGPNFHLGHPAFKNSNVTLVDLGGDNLSTRDNNRSMQYHANHVTALIAGKSDEIFEDMDLEYIQLMQQENPNLVKGYPSPRRVPFIKYYGGLAPDATVYAYARKLESEGGTQDKETLLKIFEDIETKEDIRLINLSCKLQVTPPIIKQLNRLAEKGKIFIQAAGNDGQNMDANQDERKESLQYYDGASYNDFSPLFWNRHIFVGALACSKSSSLQVQMERWKDSSYYVDNTSPHNRNFIMAPGACIFSADQQGYALRSGSSMGTALVTGALACALETNDQQDLDLLIKKLHRSPYFFERFSHDARSLTLPILNIEKLLTDEPQELIDNPVLSIEEAPPSEDTASGYAESTSPLIDTDNTFLEAYRNDHPSRWIYEAMGAWDNDLYVPTTYGRTGKGVGIAIIGSPYFNLNHPALKNSDITIVKTYASRFKLNGYKIIPGYVVASPLLIGVGNFKLYGEPIQRRREPALDCVQQIPPTFIMSEGTNKIAEGQAVYSAGGSTCATTLIAGKLDNPFKDMDLQYLYRIQNNNPNLERISYPNFKPDFTYYGGLAPDAKIYAYPRCTEQGASDRDILSAIFHNIEDKEDIRLINLGCKITVNRPLIIQLNLLAEKGKIFIQAVGNNGKNIDLEENASYGSIQYVEGASWEDFSQTFWNRHIWVGALACYKTSTSQVGMHIWNKSSYFVNRDSHNKNFILAPGACVLSASYDHYSLESGTGIATAMVTAALANALELNDSQNPDDLITKILASEYRFELEPDESINISILNIKELLSFEK